MAGISKKINEARHGKMIKYLLYTTSHPRSLTSLQWNYKFKEFAIWRCSIIDSSTYPKV